LRDALTDQLGLEPIPAVQDIHRAILSAEGAERQEQTLGARLRAIGAPIPVAA
jgi:hypothetical protein